MRRKALEAEVILLVLLSIYLYYKNLLDINTILKTVWSAIFVVVVIHGWLWKTLGVR